MEAEGMVTIQAAGPQSGPLERFLAAKWFPYAVAAVACAVTTGIAALLSPYFHPANLVMLFLLTVVLVALRFGRGPAIMASFLSVALFDFFFVPPYLSFTVDESEYLLTFGVMLAVSLIISQLTATIAGHAQTAHIREARAQALYTMARSLAAALTVEEVAATIERFVTAATQSEALVFVRSPEQRFAPVLVANNAPRGSNSLHRQMNDLDIRHLVDVTAASGDDAFFDNIGYFAMNTASRVHGVLAVHYTCPPDVIAERRELLEAVASIGASVVERIRCAELVVHPAEAQS